MAKFRTPIYLAGYPKSGTTWATRLIAQALDSPSGASVAYEDHREPATEGRDRPGRFIVRKGHFQVVTDFDQHTVVPAPHRINSTAHFTAVFIVRDPRSIAVSLSHYKGISIDEAMDGMIGGGIFGLPSWNTYLAPWLELSLERSSVHIVRYEDLVFGPEFTLTDLFAHMKIRCDVELMDKAIRDQSLEKKKAYVEEHGDEMPGGKELNRRLLRKGEIAEWQTAMGLEQKQRAIQAWGKNLQEFYYTIAYH